MLKIKNNVDLKELEKFGLEYCEQCKDYRYCYGSRYSLGIKVIIEDRLIEISGGEFDNADYDTTNILYDLIKAGLVEKVVLNNDK